MMTILNHHTLPYLHEKLNWTLTVVNCNKPKVVGYTYLTTLQSSSTKRNHKQMVIKLSWKYKSPKDQKPYFFLYLFISLALKIIVNTMVQCFEFPSNKNISNSIHINGHNTNALPLIFHRKYSSMEPALLKKLSNIKLS